MLTGYNTDFKFQGKVYHVQTEDGGANSPYITSLLYHQGAILTSRKTSYADIIKADCLDEVVRELMMEQHKAIIRELMQGKLTLNKTVQEAAPQPAAPAASQPAPAPPSAPLEALPPRTAAAPVAAPAPAEPAKEKSLDDIILDFLVQEQKDRGQAK